MNEKEYYWKLLVSSLNLNRDDGLWYLADIVHANPGRIREFIEEQKKLPPDLADKLTFIYEIVECLVRYYNSTGIRHWLARERPELDGQSAMDIFKKDWKSKDKDVQKILELAKSLSKPTAT